MLESKFAQNGLNFAYYDEDDSTFMTGFWKTDHIVMREINRISMFKPV